MKTMPVIHLSLVVILLSLTVLPVSAEDFSPTLLRLQCDPIVNYDFSGENLDIPVLVEGTPAGVVFCIFTRDRYMGVRPTTNGYLGWHYVNHIDTCIYHSQMYSFDPGSNVITWDGRDQDGSYLPVGEYRYYLWGFDNKSEKQLVMGPAFSGVWFDKTSSIREIGTDGLPLANPIWYRADSRWIIGSDPSDQTLAITTDIAGALHDGWEILGNPCLDPGNFDYEYVRIAHKENRLGSMHKIKFVPGGTAELQTDWGTDGFADTFETAGGGSAGVAIEDLYLYTTDDNHVSSITPDADFYIYDIFGFQIPSVDLTPWWSNPEDYDKGGQMNGGPDNFYLRNGYVFLNSHGSCLVQMVNPLKFLDTQDYDDFLIWSNGNGDYVFDRNFEETAWLPWVCNDYNTGPYTYSIAADDKLFSVSSAYDVGAVSFGLLAPDGTGLGYFAFNDESAGYKYGLTFIDSGSPFDGIYSDYRYYHMTYKPADWIDLGIGFTAHDSVSGIITSFADCFAPNAKIALISPNGGESLHAGDTCDITWSVEGVCYMPDYLRIEYSPDNGASWADAVVYVKTTDRSAAWTIPSIESASAKIRLVTALTGKLWDTSDAPFSIVRDVAVEEAMPHTFSLAQNTPNPFNPRTTIAFSLPEESRATLTVYTITGAKVATLVDSVLPAGMHEAQWDASDFPSGVYLCRLVAGGRSKTVKMTLVK